MIVSSWLTTTASHTGDTLVGSFHKAVEPHTGFCDIFENSRSTETLFVCGALSGLSPFFVPVIYQVYTVYASVTSIMQNPMQLGDYSKDLFAPDVKCWVG